MCSAVIAAQPMRAMPAINRMRASQKRVSGASGATGSAMASAMMSSASRVRPRICVTAENSTG